MMKYMPIMPSCMDADDIERCCKKFPCICLQCQWFQSGPCRKL